MSTPNNQINNLYYKSNSDFRRYELLDNYSSRYK